MLNDVSTVLPLPCFLSVATVYYQIKAQAIKIILKSNLKMKQIVSALRHTEKKLIDAFLKLILVSICGWPHLQLKVHLTSFRLVKELKGSRAFLLLWKQNSSLSGFSGLFRCYCTLLCLLFAGVKVRLTIILERTCVQNMNFGFFMWLFKAQ